MPLSEKLNDALIEIHLKLMVTCAKCGKPEMIEFHHSGIDVVKAIELLGTKQSEANQLSVRWELGANHKPYCSKKCREEYGVKRLEDTSVS